MKRINKRYLSSLNIAIILPAFNEQLTIKKVIEDFHLQIPSARIYIINNCSIDSTYKVAKNTLLINKIRGDVLNEFSQGKGYAIRKAFNEIDADIYIMCDSDSTYPANQIQELLRCFIDEKLDIVVGDRHALGDYRKKNERLFHNFGNLLIQFLINKIFSTNIKDVLSGYRVLSKSFVETYPALVNGFELEVDMTMHALDKNFNIREIPIKYYSRPEGSFSKLNTYFDGLKILFTIFQIMRQYKPLMFFSCLSLIATLFSLLCFVPVLEDWINFKYIYHVPLAILSAAFGIISFLMFGIGLILDSISASSRRDFEIYKHLLKNKARN
jgi:glycosyltransferase involved in cell wall biosynthesis